MQAPAVAQGPLEGMPDGTGDLPAAGDPGTEAARGAIFQCIQNSCAASLAKAVDIQAGHSARFMLTQACHKGVVGRDYSKTVKI